ncbi:unnamed protein product, partial [Polarella glacialis]
AESWLQRAHQRRAREAAAADAGRVARRVEEVSVGTSAAEEAGVADAVRPGGQLPWLTAAAGRRRKRRRELDAGDLPSALPEVDEERLALAWHQGSESFGALR